MSYVYYALSLSSNEDAAYVLEAAIAYLTQLGQVHASTLFDFPADKKNAPPYKNAAVIVRTVSTTSAVLLKAALKDIEQRLGRYAHPLIVRIDIDIVAEADGLHALHQQINALVHAPDYVRVPLANICYI